MGKAGNWLFLFLKRYCKSPGYIIILCLLPILVLWLSGREQQSETAFCAAYYMPEEAEGDKLFLNETDGTIVFKEYASREAVEEAVLLGEADCGYVFAAEFMEESGITLYTGKDESAAFMANEILLAKIFQMYSDESYVNYIRERFGAESTKEAQELLQKRLEDGSTFSFVYVGQLPNQSGAGYKEESKITAQVMPVRGMIALFLLLYGICGMLNDKKDEEAGRFVSVLHRRSVKYLNIMLPMAAGAAVSLFCLKIWGQWEGILKEAPALLWYLILTAVFVGILGKICGTEYRLLVSVPFIIIACILFTPIFFNIKAVVPVLGILEKAFPITWYLSIF